MILFLDDWKKYPNAIIHYKTRNTSFLRLAEIYRRMGVANYAFHLALLQPELEDIDPHDTNLSDDIKAKIAIECFWNPWYFFREVLKIPPRGGSEPNMFVAKRGNIALMWCFFNHIDANLTQPRQTGKTTGAHGISLYLLLVKCENAMLNLLTKDDTLRSECIKDLKKMRQYLPVYLRLDDKGDSDNTISINCAIKNTIYRTAVAQNSEAAALNLGRGLTSATKHVDEGPFIPYIDVAIPALLSSGNAARLEAKKNDTPYGNYFTSTAGKKDTRSGAYMYKLIHGGIFWTEVLLDTKNAMQLKDVVRKGSPGNKAIVNITLSHLQLGYDDKWLEETMAETDSTGDAADRDYRNIWTSGGLSSPLPIDILEQIRKSQREPLYTELTPEGYILRWYIPKDEIANYMATRKMVMGMDTSEAVNNDSITMVLLDDQSMDLVMSSNVNETNTYRFSEFVAMLMVKYENFTLIPERRSTGVALIDLLLIRLPALGIDPFKRIYNLIVDNSSEYRDEYKIIQGDLSRRGTYFYDKNKKTFGYGTSGSGYHSRDNLYILTLQQAANIACDKFYDKPLIDEITGLVSKNGRIDHSTGGHDDLVVAWLLAAWFLMHSKNLMYYGHRNVLVKTKEFRNTLTEKVERTVVDDFNEFQQQKIKTEMEGLLEELRNTSDDIIVRMIELRIKTLDGRLRSTYNDIVSVDSLIAEAKQVRNKTMRDKLTNRPSTQYSSHQRRLQQMGR